MSSRARKEFLEFKRDREDENVPVVQPEIRPTLGDCTASSVAKARVTGPRLTVEIGGEGAVFREYNFMVDTGTMVSLIQPGISRAQIQSCDVKARGVTGTKLEILGEQEIEFGIKGQGCYLTFKHTFIVSPLEHCSSGILGMDFLRRVGAEISLTTQSLNIGHYTFPLKDRECGVSKVRRLITAEPEETSDLDQEEGEDEPVWDWESTVGLAETVTVPPLSVRIARCRVVRRDDSTVVKVPRNQLVMVDLFHNLPGIYWARSVATLEVLNASDLPRQWSGKSLLVEANASNEIYSPHGKIIAGSDGSVHVTGSDGVSLNVGAGECQPECPESGLSAAATCRGNDLQWKAPPSPPVENGISNQFDTHNMHLVNKGKGQSEKLMRPSDTTENLKVKREI